MELSLQSLHWNNCGATCTLKGNLMLHMGGHQSGTKLRRPEGGKIFSRLASLGSHLYIHGEGGNPACPQCGQEFPTEKDLQQHTVVQLENDQLVGVREIPRPKGGRLHLPVPQQGL